MEKKKYIFIGAGLFILLLMFLVSFGNETRTTYSYQTESDTYICPDYPNLALTSDGKCCPISKEYYSGGKCWTIDVSGFQNVETGEDYSCKYLFMGNEIERDNCWSNPVPAVVKQKISIPSCNPNVVYNGEPQVLISAGEGYKVEDDGKKTNKGEYKFKVTTNTGYYFSNGDDEATVPCSIHPAEVKLAAGNVSGKNGSISVAVKNGNICNGELTVSFDGFEQTISIMTSDIKSIPYSVEKSVDVTIKYELEDDKNCQISNSSTKIRITVNDEPGEDNSGTTNNSGTNSNYDVDAGFVCRNGTPDDTGIVGCISCNEGYERKATNIMSATGATVYECVAKSSSGTTSSSTTGKCWQCRLDTMEIILQKWDSTDSSNLDGTDCTANGKTGKWKLMTDITDQAHCPNYTDTTTEKTCINGSLMGGNCVCYDGYFHTGDTNNGYKVCCGATQKWDSSKKQCVNDPAAADKPKGYCYECKTSAGTILSRTWSKNNMDDYLVGQTCDTTQKATYGAHEVTTEANCPELVKDSKGYCWTCQTSKNEIVAQVWSANDSNSQIGFTCGNDKNGVWHMPTLKAKNECSNITCGAGEVLNTKTLKCEKKSSGSGSNNNSNNNNTNNNNNSNNNNTNNSNNNGGNNSNVDTNAPTGNIMMFMVWIIGLGTLGYSCWYFKAGKFD